MSAPDTGLQLNQQWAQLASHRSVIIRPSLKGGFLGIVSPPM
jgi:hypothetical protein